MRAKKVDSNHAEIRDYLESTGWGVFDTAPLGRGMGDLLVSRHGHTAVLEVKAGRGEQNERQRKFRAKWQGAYFIVRSPDDATKQLNLWLLTHAQFK